jgi:hypothetical protein
MAQDKEDEQEIEIHAMEELLRQHGVDVESLRVITQQTPSGKEQTVFAYTRNGVPYVATHSEDGWTAVEPDVDTAEAAPWIWRNDGAE